MTRITAARQNHCELCDQLVSATAYTPCCGKLLCAACAQGTHCPICQTPNVGTAHQAVAAPNPAPDDWLEEDYELRVSGCDE
jgi:hypothetical protein